MKKIYRILFLICTCYFFIVMVRRRRKIYLKNVEENNNSTLFRNSTVNIMKITIITFPLYSLMHENSVFRGIQRALVEFKKQILKRKHCRNKIMFKIFKISRPLKKFCKYCFSFFLRSFSSAILNLKIAISN